MSYTPKDMHPKQLALYIVCGKSNNAFKAATQSMFSLSEALLKYNITKKEEK